MNGHQQLLAMRRAGRVPQCVWLEDGPCVQSSDWHEQANPFTQQHHAHIRVAADDIPEALDLRCLVGLTVHVVSQRDKGREERLWRAAVDAGAATAIACGYDHHLFHGKTNG